MNLRDVFSTNFTNSVEVIETYFFSTEMGGDAAASSSRGAAQTLGAQGNKKADQRTIDSSASKNT